MRTAVAVDGKKRVWVILLGESGWQLRPVCAEFLGRQMVGGTAVDDRRRYGHQSRGCD